MARPAWWRATIWIDALFFGPFYVFAIYAYIKGRNWIRFGSIIWASVMLTNVTIILFEEVMGEHAITPSVEGISFQCRLAGFSVDCTLQDVAIRDSVYQILK